MNADNRHEPLSVERCSQAKAAVERTRVPDAKLRASGTSLAWACSQGLGLLMVATEMHCQEYGMVDQSHEHGPRKVKAFI